MHEGIAHRILANTTFNAFAFVWSNGIWVFLVPYLLGGLGKEAYGVWALAGIAVGYVGMMDAGVGRSFVKHLAEAHASCEVGRLNRIVSTGMVFYFLFAIPILAAALPLSAWLMGVLGVPDRLLPEAVFVFRFALITWLASNVTGVIPGLQQAAQRFDISSKLRAWRALLNAIGCVVAIESGFGLRGLAVNGVVVYAVFGSVNLVVAYRLVPGLSLRPHRYFSRAVLRELTGFGTRLQVSRIADLLVFQADKLIIGHFLGVASVATYQLGSAVVSRVRSALTLALPVLLPAASQLKATAQRDRLSELYVRASKYLGLISIPVVAFTVVESPLLVRAWLGTGHAETALVVSILGVGYLINLLSGVGVTISLANDRPELQMHAAAISTVTNLVLNLLLVRPFGYPGVAVATSTALIAGPLYFFTRLHRDIGIRLIPFLGATYLKPFLFAALPVLVLWACEQAVGSASWGHGRLSNLLVLGLHGTLFAAGYLLLVVRGGVLDDYDRGLIRRYLRAGRSPDKRTEETPC